MQQVVAVQGSEAEVTESWGMYTSCFIIGRSVTLEHVLCQSVTIRTATGGVFPDILSKWMRSDEEYCTTNKCLYFSLIYVSIPRVVAYILHWLPPGTCSPQNHVHPHLPVCYLPVWHWMGGPRLARYTGC